ncbi:hypothetical protein [Actinoplanes teichomyceticus]|uniref:hypothetical protein n=1 Tax=Actinoplanes teichomyceticus TaxID=1867 RepID=UPI0011A9D30F|nr:hypothetical protein [Actinoplanes teichomyceticus]
MRADTSAADREEAEWRLWDPADRQDGEPPEKGSFAERAGPATAVWSRRGLLQMALGCSGWLPVPVLWLSSGPPFGATFLSKSIWLAILLTAALVSTTVILAACVRRSWGVAWASLALAATGVVVTARHDPQDDYIEYQYHTHRTALIELARDYRAGRLAGDLTLPPGVRSLSPSGFAYADRTVLFVQMWQDWRAESGTGLAYFADPPTAETSITTASGDRGQPQREVGDGWWWVK